MSLKLIKYHRLVGISTTNLLIKRYYRDRNILIYNYTHSMQLGNEASCFRRGG